MHPTPVLLGLILKITKLFKNAQNVDLSMSWDTEEPACLNKNVHTLTFTTLLVNSADGKLIIVFLIFPRKLD